MTYLSYPPPPPPPLGCDIVYPPPPQPAPISPSPHKRDIYPPAPSKSTIPKPPPPYASPPNPTIDWVPLPSPKTYAPPPPYNSISPSPEIVTPPSGGGHQTTILIACLSAGSFCFLAFLIVGLFCCAKKKRKPLMVAAPACVDENQATLETITTVPCGNQTAAFSVEEGGAAIGTTAAEYGGGYPSSRAEIVGDPSYSRPGYHPN